jgi:chromosome segregation ATPase
MPDPYDLDLAFDELHSQYSEKNKAIAEIHAKIMELEKEMEQISDPYDSKIAELRELITENVKLRGKSFNCSHGKASFRKEYERTSWDTKALAGYSAAHPEIEQFKKTTLVEASVTISVGVD